MKKTISVLIVEDETVLQDVYKLVLSTAGYKVHTAGNGAEGLSLLKKTKPDLILLDIFMPVLDGKEFLKNFNKDDFPDTKIIVYSNLHDPETKKEVFQLGADDFVLKSDIGPADLISLVSEQVNSGRNK